MTLEQELFVGASSLTIRDVVKDYGAHRAIHGVGLDVAPGEFVVLVGPSGCGKSTLLRMVAGLETISGGEVKVDGRVVNEVESKDRDMAMVFQNYALYPHLTVRENMGFSLSLRRAPKGEIRDKVDAVAKILGLEAILDRRPSALSGGQRQRVAMGRAIVRQPKVFLFDEPLSNLDAKLRVQMRAEIKRMHQRFRTTTIYVTHDQVEAMTMGDKIVVLRDGRIEQSGPPLTLFDEPANTFVAQFIGSPSMNILPGKMTGEGFLTQGGVLLPADTSKTMARFYGVRPEDVTVSREGVETVVTILEPFGSETLIGTTLGDAEFTAVVRERVALEPADTVRLLPNAQRAHLFDERGCRI